MPKVASALPRKIDARAIGATSSDVSADSSRSRCQIRLNESTDAKKIAIQIVPAAVARLYFGWTKYVMLARTPMTIANTPAVARTSRVRSSIRASFLQISQAAARTPRRRRAVADAMAHL